jgi:hypothetical protein
MSLHYLQLWKREQHHSRARHPTLLIDSHIHARDKAHGFFYAILAYNATRQFALQRHSLSRINHPFV